mgnify:CR=1 FL=1
MTKSRPEKIELKTPDKYAEKFTKMLKENIAANGNLKAESKDGNTTFAFYPTKSEYFVISLLTQAICKELGGNQIEVPD